MAEQIMSFKCGGSILTQIVPVNKEQCWVKNLNSSGISLMDSYGKVLRNLKCECFRFIVDDKGDIVYTNYPRKKIAKVDQDDEITCLISVSPLCPSLICPSVNGAFLLVAEKESDTVHKTLLFRYSIKGSLLQQICLPQELENRIDNVVDINENKNGDIAIVTRGSEENAVFIVSSHCDHGSVTYKGNTDTEKAFDPVGVCWTSDLSVLVSDNQNHCIHRLTSNGQFMNYIKVEGVYFPGPLAYLEQNNTLWAGCNDSDVSVLRLDNTV